MVTAMVHATLEFVDFFFFQGRNWAKMHFVERLLKLGLGLGLHALSYCFAGMNMDLNA